MADKNYRLTFALSDGSSKNVQFTAPQGPTGPSGADGYTPVKGVDYWTDADQESIVQELVETTGIDVLPEYVVTEAESVLDRVLSAQGSNTYTLACVSDLHYGLSSYTDGIHHMSQALKYINSRIKIDAVAMLGDYTDSYTVDNYAEGIADAKSCNALLNDLRFADNLRLQGNHDYYATNSPVTSRLIQAFSDNVTWGSKNGGYFYKDVEDYKLRIICLNTTEEGKQTYMFPSTAQKGWLAQTLLDISNKEDAENWQILILSHHPLDWDENGGTYDLANIVAAYTSGSSYAIDGTAYDYSGKNASVLIADIHGHIHNFLTGKVHTNGITGSGVSEVNRMSTPNAAYTYENHYTNWQEGTNYTKTLNSAKDTSFVIYCIDLDSYTIKAICYGAGYDRELVYHVAEVPIVNLMDTIGYQNNTRVNSSGNHVSEPDYVSTNKISVSYGDVIRTKGVNYNATTYYRGNIHYWTNDGNHAYIVTTPDGSNSNNDISYSVDADGNLTIEFTTGYATEITITGHGVGENLIVTKNQVIP